RIGRNRWRRRDVQAHIQGSVGQSAVRHADQARPRHRQEPQLHQPDLESGLPGPHPGPVSPYDLRGLPFPGRCEGCLSRGLRARASAQNRSAGRAPARTDDHAAPAGSWQPKTQRAARRADARVWSAADRDPAGRKVTGGAGHTGQAVMKKFVNAIDNMLAESLDGLAGAHADIVALGPERKFVRRRSSGHEPLHVGFVGAGMLDAACPGQIFTSPTPDQMVEAASAVGGKAGVLFIVKNYAGDCMNFEMAAELVEAPIATVVTNDDVAVEKSTHSIGRRGVAGTLVVEKIVGAAAERGMGLKACAELGTQVNGRTRSMGVAL